MPFKLQFHVESLYRRLQLLDFEAEVQLDLVCQRTYSSMELN